MTTVVTSAVVNGDGWTRLSSGPGFLAAVESPRDLADNALSQPLLVLACLRSHATQVLSRSEGLLRTLQVIDATIVGSKMKSMSAPRCFRTDAPSGRQRRTL
jgi:hypothetical protein